MKIGILTFHSVDNYGAVLQAYALQKFLSKLNMEVEIIDYRPRYFHNSRKFSFRPATFISNVVSLLKERRFEEFRSLFMKRTAVCYDKYDLESNINCYDVIVVGSDQVWSPDVDRRKEPDPIYFFDWRIPIKTKKIAYAASFGEETIAEKYVKTIRDGLQKTDVISVREKSGMDIVRKILGSRAVWVCDPVNLLSYKEWITLSSSTNIEHNYIVSYMLPANIVLSLGHSCRAENIALKHIDWNARVAVKYPRSISVPAPFQFVNMIFNSKGVVSQSFHGISFAIILHKPFIYIKPSGINKGRAVRIIDILERLGLSGRMLHDDVAIYEIINKMKEPIDWNEVDKRRNVFVSESKCWLQNSIMF